MKTLFSICNLHIFVIPHKGEPNSMLHIETLSNPLDIYFNFLGFSYTVWVELV